MFKHDLLWLVKKTELEIPLDYIDWLDEVTTFNINARYDDYKQSFYRRCTPEFSKEWIEKIEILRQWLINQL